MKKLLIGNWKSNKTLAEATEWLEFVLKNKKQLEECAGVSVVIAPPFPLLPFVKYFVNKHELPLGIAAQDVSCFDEGSFTGEVNGKLLKDFCDYVLIGHAERRKYFLDDEEKLGRKVKMAVKYGLEPVYCLHDLEINVPSEVKWIAFEPLSAIGSGSAMDPVEVGVAAGIVAQRNGNVQVLYGGSVTPANVELFLQQKNLRGLLVGGASLNAQKFLEIANLMERCSAE